MVTELVNALNRFEASGVSVHDRQIDGCHFEINPDGSGALQIRLSCLSYEAPDSPLTKAEIGFKNEKELGELIRQMISDSASVAKRAEAEIMYQVNNPVIEKSHTILRPCGSRNRDEADC